MTTPLLSESLRHQVAEVVTQGLGQYAANLALVVQANPQGDIHPILTRPDISAFLSTTLAQARAQALTALQQAWLQHSPDTTSPLYEALAADIGRAYASAPASLGEAAVHAWTSVPMREFTVGVSTPGTNPQAEVAAERAQAVRDAVSTAAQALALRNGLSVSVAGSGSRTEAIRAAAGIAPHTQFPHPVPIGGHAPPRVYQGVLFGPPLHPNCRCVLEQVPGGVRWRASMNGMDPRSCAWCRALHGTVVGAPEEEPESPVPSGPPPAPPVQMVSSADIAAMSPERYNRLAHFISAALHELGQLIRAILGIGNGPPAS